MGFKNLSLAVSVATVLGAAGGEARAAGIPVYCWNCENASYNAAHSVVDAVRAQTEAILNGMDYVMRAEQEITTARDVAREATEQKIANSYAMEPSLGAKPRTACGQYGAASLRGMAAGSAPRLQAVLTNRTQMHNSRGRNLAPSEPRREYAIKDVLEKLDDPEKPVNSGNIIMANEPIDPGDAEKLNRLRKNFELLLNPFPVEMPSQEDVERIKASGSPGEKQDLAQTIVLQKRQEVGQYIHDQEFAKNVKRLDPAAIKYLIKDIEQYLSSDQKAMLEGKISPNQLDELMATYRVRSGAWVTTATTSPSSEMANREQMLTQAEMLNQLWEIKQLLAQMLKMQAFTDVRDTSQTGLQMK